MSVERDIWDYISIGVQVATLVVTGGGLGFVAVSLWQAGRQQRLEAGPYVRVDIGVMGGESDFKGPKAYHHRADAYINLISSNDSEQSIMISAWFRNYQRHPLGMALGVSATFLIELEDADPILNDVSIAYLERGKPVAMDIAQLQRSTEARITLLSLTYVDFYDRRYVHTLGERGTNALHGRMLCLANGERIESVPVGRSRGKGVDYND